MALSNNQIRIKDLLSEDLAIRDTAKYLFKQINTIKTPKVIVDFKGIKSISRSFAQEYLQNKEIVSKSISEKNVPETVKKMFCAIEINKPKHNLKLKAISLNL